TPACSSAIAAEWRSVCGETFLAAMPGQVRAALAACLPTSLGIASRDNRRPAPVVNTGSAGPPGCSASQTRSAATVCRVSGVARSLSFAGASDVRAVLLEVNVAAGQRDQFGDPQPGLAGQQQQGVVAASQSGGAIGSG